MTKIRKSTEHPRAQRTFCVFKQKPKKDDIVKLIKEHFTIYQEDVVTNEDILKITNMVLKKLEGYPYSNFENTKPQKTELSITIYSSEKKLCKKEICSIKRYPINVCSIRCSKINFRLTIVYPLKKIKLSYVSS